MNIKKIIILFYTGMVLLATALSAYATGPGFYFGMNLGSANLNNIADDVVAAPQYTLNGTPAQICPGPTCASDFNVTPSNTGLAARIFLGTNINEYAGAELGYTHFTASEYDTNLVNQQIVINPAPPPGSPTTAVMLTNTPTIRESAIDLDVKVMYPLSKINVFGKLGMSYTRRTMSGSLTDQANDPTAKRNGTVNQLLPLIAIGTSYDFTPRWVVDFTYTRILKGGNDFKEIDFYGVGISYHFVTEYCGQFIC